MCLENVTVFFSILDFNVYYTNECLLGTLKTNHRKKFYNPCGRLLFEIKYIACKFGFSDLENLEKIDF